MSTEGLPATLASQTVFYWTSLALWYISLRTTDSINAANPPKDPPAAQDVDQRPLVSPHPPHDSI